MLFTHVALVITLLSRFATVFKRQCRDRGKTQSRGEEQLLFVVFVSAGAVSLGGWTCELVFIQFLTEDTVSMFNLPAHHHRKQLLVSVRRVLFYEGRRRGAKLRGLLFPSGL